MIDTLFMMIKLQTLPRCTTPLSEQHAGGAETIKMHSCFKRQQSPQRADEDVTVDEYFSFAEGTVHFYKPRVA